MADNKKIKITYATRPVEKTDELGNKSIEYEKIHPITTGNAVVVKDKEGNLKTLNKALEEVGGIEDAPNDGKSYVRNSQEWSEITAESLGALTEHDISNKVDKIEGSSLVPDTKVESYDLHIIDINNPHNVTKALVGLDLVDNTPDNQKVVAKAQELAITGATDTSAYKERQTFGQTSGAVTVDKVSGNSVVWNQLENRGFSAGWKYQFGTGTSLEGGGYSFTSDTVYWNNWAYKKMSSPFIIGHVYVVYGELMGYGCFSIGEYNPYLSGTVVEYSSWTKTGIVKKIPEREDGLPHNSYGITTPRGGHTISCRAIAFADLTQMFGKGNEPSTYEEFLARKPKVEDEYAYNEGEIVSATPLAKKNTGVNLCNSKWEKGKFNLLEGTPDASDIDIRTKDFVRVVPGLIVYLNYGYGSILCYDEDKNFLKQSGLGSQSSPSFTVPSNCYYVKIVCWSRSNFNNICFNIFDPAINGKYFPYEEKVIPMPTTLDGQPITLHSAGNVRDEIDFKRKKVVRRVGRVDLGSMVWKMASSDYDYWILCGLPDAYKKSVPHTNVGNAIMAGYTTTTRNGFHNLTHHICIDQLSQLNIINSGFQGKSLNDIVSSLQGQFALVELATPYEEDIIVPATSAECVGNGMEIVEFEGAVPTITANYMSGQAAKWNAMPDPSEIVTRHFADYTYEHIKPTTWTLELTSSPAFMVKNKGAIEDYLEHVGGYLFLNKDGKTYAAKLDTSDWSKLADGTAVTAALEDATETMIHLPKGYYKGVDKTCYFYGLNGPADAHTYDGPHWVSAYMASGDSSGLHSRPNTTPAHSLTMSTFQTWAQELGADWGQWKYQTWSWLNLLYLAKYGNLNSQATIGAGFLYSNWEVCLDVPMGKCKSLGDGSGCVLYNDATLGNQYPVKLFGFEDLWGKMWQFTPGIRFYMGGSIRHAVIYSGNIVSNTAEGRDVSPVLSSASGTYASKMQLGEHWDMICQQASGSSNTYYCDGYWASTSGLLLVVGATANNNAKCGISFQNSNSSVLRLHKDTGARLAFYNEPTIVSGKELVTLAGV